MQFSAPWLPDGPIELAPIPTKGERELRALELQDAEVEAFGSDYRFYVICKGILAAEHVLSRLGAEKAKQSWDEWLILTFSQVGSDGKAKMLPGFKDLIWPVEMFEESLKANKDTFIFQQLAAKDDEGAKDLLKALGEKIEDRAKSVTEGAIKRIGQRPLLAMYWRLRASRVSTLLLPTGPYKPDWGSPADQPDAREKKKAAVIDVLSEIVSPADLGNMNGPPKERALDLQELMPHSVADVEGKSVTRSEPSTPSNHDSAHSSVATTVTATG